MAPPEQNEATLFRILTAPRTDDERRERLGHLSAALGVSHHPRPYYRQLGDIRRDPPLVIFFARPVACRADQST